MREVSVKLATVAGTVLLAVAVSTPAMARIKCSGPFQIVSGSRLMTPYCADNYLARVARGYGIKVSNRTIRQNPNKKREVCDFIGSDTRVYDICVPLRRGGRVGL